MKLTDIVKAYLCSTEAKKIYLGSELVYSGSRLPTGYTEVEYISSDGTHYVDLGIIQTTKYFEMEMKFKWTGSTTSKFESFMAYMAESGTLPRSGFHKYQGEWMFGTNNTCKTTVAADNDEHTILIIGNGTDKLYMDSTLIGSMISSGNLESNTIPFFAFARNRSTSIDNPATADIYYIKYKQYDSSTLDTLVDSYEMISCYNSSNVYGFYDIVNDEFHPLVSS